MATTADAELILKLYQLRGEETMRKARKFIVFEFWPKSFEELTAVRENMLTQESAYWRQVLTYWEMAASMVLRGAVDPDLFLDSQGEGIYIYAKFQPFREEMEKAGQIFMKQTAKMIEEHSAAKTAFDSISQMLAARAAAMRG